MKSNPRDCPLGKRHPPNGIEFGLGCSLCNEQATFAEDSAKRKEEAKLVAGLIDAMLSSLFSVNNQGGFPLPFNEGANAFSGLFAYLCTFGFVRPPQQRCNPVEAGLVKVTTVDLVENTDPPQAALGLQVLEEDIKEEDSGLLMMLKSITGAGASPDKNIPRVMTTEASRAWFKVELERFSLIPTHYTLRHYGLSHGEALR